MAVISNIDRVVFIVIGICVGSLTFTANAHEGDVNNWGCHLDNNTGRSACHCHRSDPIDQVKRDRCLYSKPVLQAEDDTKKFPNWRGLRVEYETECTDYRSDRYTYPRNSDVNVAEDYGAWYAPYEDVCYLNRFDVTIEHMVARSQGHYSGLCSASQTTKLRFASDPDNITLAHGDVNSAKGNKDATDWLPDHNKCWYVNTVIKVKQKYDLSIDPAERDAMQEVLDGCSANDLLLVVPQSCKDEFDADAGTRND